MIKFAHIFILIFATNVNAQYSNPERPNDVKALKYVADTFIKKDGSSTTKIHIVKKIETDAGRMQVALTKINFLKSKNSFKLVEAYTLNANDRSDVNSKKVTIRSADKVEHGLSDLMEAIIPYENLQVGGEAHLIYEISSKSKDGNYFSDVLLVSNETLAKVEQYNYTSEVPLKMEQVDYHPYFKVSPVEVQGLYSYRVEATPPGYSAEGVDVQNSTFVASTLTSWEQLRKTESGNYEPVLKKSLPKKYEKIAESAKGLTNPKDIIEQVARELAKAITYSGDWQTQKGKFVPQDMQDVAAKGRGDCKDYSTAMIAILRKLNFTAYPFLTFRSQAYAGPEKLRGLTIVPTPFFFNHVIVHAKDSKGKIWWIDPTNPYVQADTITSDILGNFGLILDEAATDVTFLPEKNPEPSNLTMMRSLVIDGDNSINGKAVMSLTTSSHNTFGMVERMYGQQGLAKTFSFLLNPSLKSTKVEIKKLGANDHKYEFDFVANDWVIDQKKIKLFVLINPLAFLVDRLGIRKDIDIGEPGLTKIVTRIKKQKVEDTVAAGCLVRSTWFSFDRIVENTPDALIVTDELTVKKRFISKRESEGDAYEVLLGDVSECVREASTLVIHSDPSPKSGEEIEEEKLKGPLLEVMTDKQADDLYEMERSKKTNFLRTKLVRFYQNKLKKQATASSYRKIGNLIINLGYISGDLYGAGYMEDGLGYYAKALSLATGSERDEILAELVNHEVSAHKISEAVAHFKEYYKNNPKKYEAFDIAANIALAQNKVQEAEGWLNSGVKYAQTKDEKVLFNKSIQDVLWRQKKYAESIPYQEKVLELVPNGWNHHNLAILYFEIKDYDKVIELEIKALALMEFGLAKHYISKAYLEKYMINGQQMAPRSPAQEDEASNFLQQAIKYDPQNVDALSTMAMFKAREFIRTKDKTALIKGKNYLDQAAEVNPNEIRVHQALKIFKQIEDGKKLTELDVQIQMAIRYN